MAFNQKPQALNPIPCIWKVQVRFCMGSSIFCLALMNLKQAQVRQFRGNLREAAEGGPRGLAYGVARRTHEFGV